MRYRTWSESDLIKAVKTSVSVAECLNKLGLKPTGGNYKQFRKYVSELHLDISHFSGQSWAKGKKRNRKNVNLVDILTIESHYKSSRLRHRLVAEGLKERKCESCGGANWMGGPIPLELDHINGNNTDNRLTNLRILCPNCHALTPNYRGKNKRASGGKAYTGDLNSPPERDAGSSPA